MITTQTTQFNRCNKPKTGVKPSSFLASNVTHKVTYRGFTLVEMLIVISIATILAFMAMPSMSESIQNSKVKELSSEFTAALYLTRSEAIKRGIQVTISPQQSSGSSWQTGWNIFEDSDRNGMQGADEELIQTHSMPDNGLTLVSEDSTFASWLAFLPSGGAKGSAGINGGFRICRADQDATKSRSITVQGPGNIIVEAGTPSCP